MFKSKASLVKVLAVLSAGLLNNSPVAAQGPGDLVVAPVRVVFDGRDRVAEVTLVSRASRARTYRVDFQNRRMTDDGKFVPIEQAGPGDLFAEKLVRYAPRRVDLGPGESQTIRLLLRKPSGLAEGEYRSHLHFAAVPDDAGAASVERTATDASGLSIKLTPIYGLTIPVIVRHGNPVASPGLSNARLEPWNGLKTLTIDLMRTGSRSIYGDITVKSARSGQKLTELRGIAVYVPNDRRHVRLAIEPDLADRLKSEPFVVSFSERDAAKGSEVSVTFDPLG
ncbi:MAG: hypothetical protein HRU11_11685 [Parvularculaceae bacterium]|nr:hypothetical protein [Parvularculaceae bacterium]